MQDPVGSVLMHSFLVDCAEDKNHSDGGNNAVLRGVIPCDPSRKCDALTSADLTGS